jgi:hypothetical protein
MISRQEPHKFWKSGIASWIFPEDSIPCYCDHFPVLVLMTEDSEDWSDFLLVEQSDSGSGPSEFPRHPLLKRMRGALFYALFTASTIMVTMRNCHRDPRFLPDRENMTVITSLSVPSRARQNEVQQMATISCNQILSQATLPRSITNNPGPSAGLNSE